MAKHDIRANNIELNRIQSTLDNIPSEAIISYLGDKILSDYDLVYKKYMDGALISLKSPLMLNVSDFEPDGVTYINAELDGITNYLIYLNGVRFLIPDEDFVFNSPPGGFILNNQIFEGQYIFLIF